MNLSALKSYSFEVALVALAVLSLTDSIPVEDKTALFATMGALISASIKNAISKRYPLLLMNEELIEVQSDPVATHDDVEQVKRRLDSLLQQLGNFPKAPLLLFGLLIGPPLAEAKEPKAIISGPRYAEPGEDVFLDFSQSENEPDRYHVAITPNNPGRSQLEIMDGGRRARVKTYPGTWHVRLIVSNEDGWDEHTHTIIIPGNPPCPTPPPTPNPLPPLPEPPEPPSPTPTPQPEPKPTPAPDPQPITPEPGRFALAPAVFRLASSAKAATRVADCQMLGRECRRIAAKPESFSGMTAMAAAIVAVLQTLPEGWEPLKTETADAFTRLYTSGQLRNRDDIAALLLELAFAFEQAALVK